MNYNTAQCRKGLHDYHQVADEGYRIVSKCSICNKVIYENPKDNKTFLKNHRRDFLQRSDKDYFWIYGENKPFEKEQDKAWEEKEKKPFLNSENVRTGYSKKYSQNLKKILNKPKKASHKAI